MMAALVLRLEKRRLRLAAASALLILLIAHEPGAVRLSEALEWTGGGACEAEAFEWYAGLMGFTPARWNRGGAGNVDGKITMGNLTNGFGVIEDYMSVGDALARTYNPLAAAFLPYARSASMMDHMIDLPTESNEPEDVVFELPDAADVEYSGVDDLLHMPIRTMASLLAARRVSCVDLIEFFIGATERLDPLLGIVSVTLFDEARAAARALDAELAATGSTRSPLHCIPYAPKDIHMVYNETTTVGHILNYNNVHSLRSSLTTRLADAGAIPIAKALPGSFAMGAVHGWGVCMSPYLNGQGSGSSCGSASGAAAGIFPFALSEETGGSIVNPSAASFVSGFLSSYGVLSRAGADLRSREFDHFGFHSRYLSDYGILLNEMRSGVDPLDGDTVAFKFEDPAKIDPTALSVLVVGEGAFSSFGVTGFKWESERLRLVVAALEAAGVAVTVKSAAEARAMWRWDETEELFRALSVAPLIGITSQASVWGVKMFDQLSARNTKGDQRAFAGSKGLPSLALSYAKLALVKFGRLFFSDPLWDEFDVIIDTNALKAGNYASRDEKFEHWVRTAKVSVVDHMERSDLIGAGAGAVEGTTVTLTGLPWSEAKVFRIGEIIQEYEPIRRKVILPDFALIEEHLAGRTRCAAEFFDKMDASRGMVVREDGSPDENRAWMYTHPVGCPAPRELEEAPFISPYGPAVRDAQYIPTGWAASPYVPPYALEARGLSAMPIEAVYDIWRFTEEEVCALKPSFCEYNRERGFPVAFPGAPMNEDGSPVVGGAAGEAAPPSSGAVDSGGSGSGSGRVAAGLIGFLIGAGAACVLALVLHRTGRLRLGASRPFVAVSDAPTGTDLEFSGR